MLQKLKNLFNILIIILGSLALSPIEDGSTVYFYNLKFLENSDEPKIISLIKIDEKSKVFSKIKKGVLFTYKNRSAKKVYVAGNFSNWELIKMQRSDFGVWYAFYKSPDGAREIKYKYMIDGIWRPDPKNTMTVDDGMGSSMSILNIEIIEEKRNLTYKYLSNGYIEFRLYRPEANMISIIGDFNNWNPENDLLKKDFDGVWRLKKKISPGIYRYKFIIDGKWVPDIYNEKSSSDPIGEPCSLILIKK